MFELLLTLSLASKQPLITGYAGKYEQQLQTVEHESVAQNYRETEKPTGDEVYEYCLQVGGFDLRYAHWCAYIAYHESRLDPKAINPNDMHDSGKSGSYGMFQFGESTIMECPYYADGWETDWHLQAKCANYFYKLGMQDKWYTNNNNFNESML